MRLDTELLFDATIQSIAGILIVKLPDAMSKRLPSRGQVAVRGTLNDNNFATVLEPDGNWGHWFKVSPYRIGAGDMVRVHVTVTKDWPEPSIPTGLSEALSTASEDVQSLWTKITPMARWEWVRWINETANPITRQRRVEISISKMEHGKRRPCCFNLSACTDPTVSKSGRLLAAS